MYHPVNIRLVVCIGAQRNLVLILPDAVDILKIILFAVFAVLVTAKYLFKYSFLCFHRDFCKMILLYQRNIAK